ncbi:hypothetical protein MBANPS3_011913 [Mucor bainieri]
MAYFQKTVHSYWDLDEAIKELKKKRYLRSNTKATDSLRSELNSFANATANAWKRQWSEQINHLSSEFTASQYSAASQSILSGDIRLIRSASKMLFTPL